MKKYITVALAGAVTLALLSACGGTQAAVRTASLAYLWNAVRVQGGAYGVGLTAWMTALNGCFYSFRDPTPARSLDCYRASSGFLRQAKDMDLTGMVIGAVAQSDPLLTARMKGKTADTRYWQGTSYEDLCRHRRELLSAGPEDLEALAADLDRLAEEGSVCVLGSKKQLDACAGLDEVTVL